MSIRTKQFLKLLVKVVVATLLLALVFSKVDFEHFRETVKTARWQYLLGVWGSTDCTQENRAVALQWILKKQDCRVSLHTIFGATCITAMYSLVVPGIVSTGVKWYILKRTTGKGVNALSAMLYNQVMLTVVMMTVGLVGLLVVDPTQALWPNAGPLWILPLVCGAALGGLLLLSVLALNERTGGLVIRLLTAALKPGPQALQDKGQTLLAQLATFQSAGWRFHLTVAGLNIADGLLVGLLWYLFAAWAASAVVPVSVLVWLCAIVFLLGKLQITVANLGVREWVLVSLLPAYGVTQSTALLMSMVLLSSQLFLATLGVVYQLAWTIRSRKASP